MNERRAHSRSNSMTKVQTFSSKGLPALRLALRTSVPARIALRLLYSSAMKRGAATKGRMMAKQP